MFFKKKKNKNDSFSNKRINAFPHLLAIKPKERYVFCSDYFKIDNSYAVILAYFHEQGAQDNFVPFWGINRIPSGLSSDVVTINFEQIARMGEQWVQQHQTSAEGIAQINDNSQAMGGTTVSKFKSARTMADLAIIAKELTNGASYLNVHNRLLVKAPTLEALDDAVTRIERLYTDRFGTLWAAPYTGEQRQELTNLFVKNEKKRGKGFYYTSTEFAGSYSLVTHGLEDSGGEYVGHMVGDVNTSAVLFDVNKFKHHVTIASEQRDNERDSFVADMWGSKLSQACLLDNGRVVHIILNDADLDKLGPKFKTLTYTIDMNKGGVNMFEMFGEEKDELVVFSAQIEKLTLMAEQMYHSADGERAIIRGSLADVLDEFYVYKNMWVHNAIVNRDALRIVGLDHGDVPVLQEFVAHLRTRVKEAEINSPASETTHALNVIYATFKNMLNNNGDLFNTVTTDAIDGVKNGRRIIYDFSRLSHRSEGIAMAQLVNIIGYAVQTLMRGDLVIFHGAQRIDADKNLRKYIDRQLELMYIRGGRAAFLYTDIDKMLDDQVFNQFDKADYTIFGYMTDNLVDKYQKKLGQTIPKDLVSLIADKNDQKIYLRRGYDNVVFRQELLLDPISSAKGKRNLFKKKGGRL